MSEKLPNDSVERSQSELPAKKRSESIHPRLSLQPKAEERDIQSSISALASALKEGGDGETNKARFDEEGNANKLITLPEPDGVPPVRCCGKEWRGYLDGAWENVDKDVFRPRALAIIKPRKYRTHRNAISLLDHLESKSQCQKSEFLGVAKIVEEEEGQGVLVNCANGVVEAWHGEECRLIEHQQGHMFTQRVRASFHRDASCPRFLEVLANALPDEEDRRLFQVFAGSILFPSARHEAALVIYGPGGTGKSTLAGAMADTLAKDDDENGLVTSLSIGQICDAKDYSLPDLRWSAVNLGTEIDTIELGEASNFKRIVSGERFSARGIYSKPERIATSCKLCFLANSLPRFKHGSIAELRRLRFLNFDVVIEEENRDPDLKAALCKERDGIFRWMLDGLLDLQNLQKVPEGGKKSQHAKEKFSICNDPVGHFVKTRCDLQPGAQEKKDVLFEAYSEMLEHYGLSVNMRDWFLRSLQEHYEVNPKRASINGQRVHVLTGICLKDEYLFES